MWPIPARIGITMGTCSQAAPYSYHLPRFYTDSIWLSIALGRGHHRNNASRSGAENRETRPLRYFQGVHHRACAGLKTTAERSKNGQIQGARNLDDVTLGGQCMSSERRLTEEVTPYAADFIGIASVHPGEAEVQIIELPTMSRPASSALGAAAARL